jgi:hypothetical protein
MSTNDSIDEKSTTKIIFPKKKESKKNIYISFK